MNPQILYNIFEKVSKRRSQGKDVIKLNVGEPEQSPPKSLISAINTSFKLGRITYGPATGDPKLRKVLARKHGVKEENILIGPGSKFLIYASLKLLLSKNNGGILIPLPAWSAFSLMLSDLKIKNIVFLPTHEKDSWNINVNHLKRKLSKNVNTIIITNPNNPTSTTVDTKTVKEIENISIKRDITLIKDCAYDALQFTKTTSKTNLKNTIEINSFSKKFCMTGFRIGYLIASKEIVETLTRFMQITISNVPLFIQDGAIELLKKEPRFPRKIAGIYKKRAKLIGDILKKNNITFVKPQAGFYIFANIGKPSEKLCLDLIDKGVSFVPGTAFGPYPNYIRISLTENEDRLKKGIGILIKSLSQASS